MADKIHIRPTQDFISAICEKMNKIGPFVMRKIVPKCSCNHNLIWYTLLMVMARDWSSLATQRAAGIVRSCSSLSQLAAWKIQNLNALHKNNIWAWKNFPVCIDAYFYFNDFTSKPNSCTANDRNRSIQISSQRRLRKYNPYFIRARLRCNWQLLI